MLGFEQLSRGGNDVAHVPVLELLVYRLSHSLIIDVKLNLPCAVLHRGKTCFAHHAFEHHAPRNRDLHIGLF